MEKPPKYAVVVVHGIGPGTGDTRREFSAILKENVRKAMIPSDSDIVWKEAEWEGVNDNIDAIARRVLSELCSRYINDVQYKLDDNGDKSGKCGKWFWRVVGNLFSKAERAVLYFQLGVLKAAKQYLPDIVDAAIDLPLYMQDPKQDEIRNIVRDAIAWAGQRAGKVILIGHSLGSVIAFDVAVAALSGEAQSPLAALVTMGSPLNWVTDIRRSRAGGGTSMLRIDSIPWINFWDAEDPVTEFKKLDIDLFPAVRNIEVKSDKKLFKAHCNYWEDKTIEEAIARMLGGDFEWIKSLQR